MEFAKLFNFETTVAGEARLAQLLVTYAKGSDEITEDLPDVIIIKTVDPVDGREWVVHLPHYFNKDACRAYFDEFGTDDAIFWRSFIRRQISTPVYLDKIKFFITEINDIAYIPFFLDGMRQEYDLSELYDEDIGALEVQWKPDGCYWQAREVPADEVDSNVIREEFQLQVNGEITDSFRIDHTERRSNHFLAQTLMLEIQKITYALEKEDAESLDSI